MAGMRNMVVEAVHRLEGTATVAEVAADLDWSDQRTRVALNSAACHRRLHRYRSDLPNRPYLYDTPEKHPESASSEETNDG